MCIPKLDDFQWPTCETEYVLSLFVLAWLNLEFGAHPYSLYFGLSIGPALVLTCLPVGGVIEGLRPQTVLRYRTKPKQVCKLACDPFKGLMTLTKGKVVATSYVVSSTSSSSFPLILLCSCVSLHARFDLLCRQRHPPHTSPVCVHVF